MRLQRYKWNKAEFSRPPTGGLTWDLEYPLHYDDFALDRGLLEWSFMQTAMWYLNKVHDQVLALLPGTAAASVEYAGSEVWPGAGRLFQQFIKEWHGFVQLPEVRDDMAPDERAEVENKYRQRCDGLKDVIGRQTLPSFSGHSYNNQWPLNSLREMVAPRFESTHFFIAKEDVFDSTALIRMKAGLTHGPVPVNKQDVTGRFARNQVLPLTQQMNFVIIDPPAGRYAHCQHLAHIAPSTPLRCVHYSTGILDATVCSLSSSVTLRLMRPFFHWNNGHRGVGVYFCFRMLQESTQDQQSKQGATWRAGK